jgi:sugar/nucleoside kinase (ribokinase family)
MMQARRRGIPVTIDPGSAGFLRQIGPEQFLRWTNGATMCFPNADEAATLAATDDHDEQMRCLSDIYGLLVVKRGAAGAEAATRHGDYWTASAKPAAVLDTTGAGDAFLAAFLASYIKGASVPICLARGVEAGSKATEFFGGRPGSQPPVV